MTEPGFNPLTFFDEFSKEDEWEKYFESFSYHKQQFNSLKGNKEQQAWFDVVVFPCKASLLTKTVANVLE